MYLKVDQNHYTKKLEFKRSKSWFGCHKAGFKLCILSEYILSLISIIRNDKSLIGVW